MSPASGPDWRQDHLHRAGRAGEQAREPAGHGTPPEMSLAVLTRLVQWQLDDLAFSLTSGRTTAEQRAELVRNLEGLAQLVRYMDGGGVGG